MDTELAVIWNDILSYCSKETKEYLIANRDRIEIEHDVSGFRIQKHHDNPSILSFLSCCGICIYRGRHRSIRILTRRSIRNGWRNHVKAHELGHAVAWLIAERIYDESSRFTVHTVLQVSILTALMKSGYPCPSKDDDPVELIAEIFCCVNDPSPDPKHAEILRRFLNMTRGEFCETVDVAEGRKKRLARAL